MTSASSLAFPGGRTLAGWWRQLAGCHPDAFWTGYLTFHRIEALVRAVRPHKLPSAEYLVLRALALHRPTAETGAVARLLHLAPDLVRRMLRHLVTEGLAAWSGASAATLTPAGGRALERGEYPRPHRERRAFYFAGVEGDPARTRYVDLPHAERLPWLPVSEAPFEVAHLRECVGRPEEWKRRHGFPLDVTELLDAPDTANHAWEHVVVATPHRLFAAIVRAPAQQGLAFLGFPGQVRTWELHAHQPAFTVPEEHWLPTYPPEVWRQAFVEWCEQRQIPPAQALEARLTVEGDQLAVEASGPLQERLLAAKGETWLLAGDGPVRQAARLR